MADNKLVFGYWGLSGLGNPIRYLLSYLEADFKDEVYTDFDKWFKADKAGLGIPLANLPYLIDGGFKLSESTAILKYLPKRFNKTDLLGKTTEDQARVDQLLGFIGDINSAFGGAMREGLLDGKKDELYGKIKDKTQVLEGFVKENYALGYLTIVDFRLADIVYTITNSLPDQTKDDLKNLRQISKNVHELPQVKKYLETGVKTLLTPAYHKTTLNLP